jgi:hypothetical protein
MPKMAKVRKTRTLSKLEDGVVERAMRFAHSKGRPINLWTVRGICAECGIEWPTRTYTLEFRHVKIPDTDRPFGDLLALRRSPGSSARRVSQLRHDAVTLSKVRDSLQRSLEWLLALSAGENIAVLTYSVDAAAAIANMTESRSGKLPAEVLTAYAVALLAEGPRNKYLRRCAIPECQQVFIAPKTGGRTSNKCESHRRPPR